MSAQLRSLAPAPERGSPPGEKTPPSNVPLPQRRKIIKNACRNCQAKKTKCDGKRPQCSRCSQKELSCTYDTLYEGMTKQQSAEYEINTLNSIIADLNQKLHVLVYDTEDRAQAMLASLRRDAANEARGKEKSTLSDGSDYSTPDGISTPDNNFPPRLFNREEWKAIPYRGIDSGRIDPALIETEPGGSSSRAEASQQSDKNSPPQAQLQQQQQQQQQQSQPQHPQMVYQGNDPQQSKDFGNLPFSSSIYANHYPSSIQNQQAQNLFAPLWASPPLNTLPGSSSVKDSVSATMRRARSLLQAGRPAEQVIGKKCNIAAIFDQPQYHQSPLLSKWAAGLIYSIQLKNRDYVAYASMHLAWTLAKWMIEPRPDTYETVPEFMRPTMNQIFVPHVEIVDFVIWPALRDLIINNPTTLQKDFRWLEDMSRTVQCDWFVDPELALETDPDTGELFLTEAAKTWCEQQDNWSVGPSIQQYIQDAVSVIRVRLDEPSNDGMSR